MNESYSYSLSTTCSCRVDGYSFYIGLLIPFGFIYIMNWVIFILILASLLCRPNVRKETNNSGNIRKLKENFMIALGLSLLFGMGWAVGLLASSGLPPAVRHPAEWIFTLASAFLGVYLFILYILRSAEARKFWKRLFFCLHKKKRAVSFSSSSTQTRSRLRSVSTTLASWRDTLMAGRSSTKTRSTQRTTHADLHPVNLELVERMKPEDWYYSNVYSPTESLPPESTTGAVIITGDRRFGQNTSAAESQFSVAEEPTHCVNTDEGIWFYNPVHVSQQCQDTTLSVAVSTNVSSSQSAPS